MLTVFVIAVIAIAVLLLSFKLVYSIGWFADNKLGQAKREREAKARKRQFDRVAELAAYDAAHPPDRPFVVPE